MKRSIQEWRSSKDYLPDFLKDFHDQKDFFKAMHSMIKVEEHEYAKDISWVVGHCYVIDIFLWFLSRFGYKIQKSTAQVNFEDLDAAIELCMEIRYKQFAMFSEQEREKNGNEVGPAEQGQ